MADRTVITTVKDVSLILWNELCRHIGTKELIYVRRRRSVYYENINNYIEATKNPYLVYFETGSRAEGLDLPGSDEDYMGVRTDTTVIPPLGTRFNNSEADLIMDSKDVKPGFVRLRVTDASAFRFRNVTVEIKNDRYVSSQKERDRLVQELIGSKHDAKPHGPCATYVTASKLERDALKCFATKTWPDTASEWKSRRRPNKWPANTLVQNIVSDGCILVPIGNPMSNQSDIEWRISFSIAEKKLVYSMNHTQLLCYGMLKLYLKHAIESEADLKNLLCSYFLKTCLFYCIEEDNIKWDEKNFTNCFWTCFNRLLHWVSNGYCPNYFIKENNMFEGKICGEKRTKLLRHLINLHERGDASFRKIPYLSDLFSVNGSEEVQIIFQWTESKPSMVEVEFFLDIDILFRETFPHNRTWISICQWMSFLKSQHSTNTLNHTFDKLLYKSFVTLFTQRIYLQCVQRSRLNKDRFKYIKLVKNIILHKCKDIDTCTGWLQYATLCYITGQYNAVIKMLKHLLGKFKPYTVYSSVEYTKVNKKAYVSNICGRGLSALQKKRLTIAPAYRISIDCWMYPFDIESEIKDYSREQILFIPALVYLNVLLCLSYKALGCTQLRLRALVDLYASIRDSSFYTRGIDFENLLAIALKCHI